MERGAVGLKGFHTLMCGCGRDVVIEGGVKLSRRKIVKAPQIPASHTTTTTTNSFHNKTIDQQYFEPIHCGLQ